MSRKSKSKQKQKMRGPSRPVNSRYTARRVVVTRRGPDPFALWLIGISTALVIVVVFWVATSNRGNNNAAQTLSATQIPLVPTPAPAQATQTAIAFATETGNLNRISVDELKSLVAANNVRVIDVRAKESYDAKHIKGAVNVPEAETFNRPKEFPRDGNLVVYCQ